MKKILFVLFPAFVIAHAGAQSLDYQIMKEWNIEERSEGWKDVSKFFSDQNQVFIIAVPAALLANGYFKNDKAFITAGKQALLSLGVSAVVTWAGKYTFRRRRPFEKYPDVVKLSSGGGPSFPSGHASSAFAIATSVSMSFPKWYVMVPCYIWASGVGVSRIVLGVHYPSDVLAGAIVGAGSAYVTHKINKWLQKDKHKSLAKL